MYIIFYSTSHVFEAEERLKEKGIEYKIVPTPVTDKAYCGICLEIEVKDIEDHIEDLEHKIIE